jgi:hypothetical protein
VPAQEDKQQPLRAPIAVADCSSRAGQFLHFAVALGAGKNAGTFSAKIPELQYSRRNPLGRAARHEILAQK